LDISSKKVCKLTPREVALAIGVEFSLLSTEDSVFSKRVYALLNELVVSDGKYTLNLVDVLYEFLSVCEDYKDSEFAKATFDSLYKTWTAKEDFDRNFNLTGKEGNLDVDEANLSQLLKTWIFLMSEMFHRFFYTYDPRCTDSSKAYYTVLHDATKRKRTCSDFLEFLECIRPIYAQLCMISADKSEIHTIFTTASTEAKAAAAARRAAREQMRSSPRKTTGKKVHQKSFVKKETQPKQETQPKEKITLAERIARLDANLKAIAQPTGKVIELPPAPPSVWKKPWNKKEESVVAVAAAAAAAESESESESEAEAPVAAKAESDGEGEFVVVQSRKTKPKPTVVEVKKPNGRMHRVFSSANKKQ
jgi:hypothetical protein